MNTFRTIIIIVGILVAGAAFNSTLAQDLSPAERSEKRHVKIKHERIKNIEAKEHKREHKDCTKSVVKARKYKMDKAHKHELKASVKGHKKHLIKHTKKQSDSYGRLE
jgi:hypothetical protein